MNLEIAHQGDSDRFLIENTITAMGPSAPFGSSGLHLSRRSQYVMIGDVVDPTAADDTPAAFSMQFLKHLHTNAASISYNRRGSVVDYDDVNVIPADTCRA